MLEKERDEIELKGKEISLGGDGRGKSGEISRHLLAKGKKQSIVHHLSTMSEHHAEEKEHSRSSWTF